ncbi:MAG TPA: M56 family metallopeptidase [Rhizomicrobium sp.]|nr:M56 family metallopeptidase [Rhizomicrobium sp.]
MSALADHLWQSTLFAGALGLLTLAFRDNRAAVRYGLWFAASLKFLVPFPALLALGERLAPATATVAPVFTRMVARLLPDTHLAAVMPAAPAPQAAMLLSVVWACGFAGLTALWLVRLARLNRIVREARSLSTAGPLPVKASAALLEPGLVGIWRPVLLLPESILAHLSPRELAAIEAHERCHLARRDNLTAAIHMTIANLFWFHPLMWWLGARLVEERERACDEAVLDAGSEPETYAGSILKVCAFTTQSELLCAAGVSGANLKRRIETIMNNRPATRLGAAKKSLLAAVAAAAVAAPVLIGLASTSGAGTSQQERLAEQRKPRAEIAFDPAGFDKFVGYYRMDPATVFAVARSGNRFLVGTIGQTPDRVYPESASKFFLKGFDPPAQYSFTAHEMVLHQSGEEQHAPRIAESEGKAAEAALAQRIARNKPSPGTEAALRRQIDGLMSGHPDYSIMAPNLAAGTRQMLGALHAKIAAWGPVMSVTFVGVAKDGMDVYEVACRDKRSKWEIGPLTADGRIASIFFGEV